MVRGYSSSNTGGKIYMSLEATEQVVFHTDVRILRQLSANLKVRIHQHNLTSVRFSSGLAIVDDERDMRNLRIFYLNVIYDENFRRHLPHQSSTGTSKSVKC